MIAVFIYLGYIASVHLSTRPELFQEPMLIVYYATGLFFILYVVYWLTGKIEGKRRKRQAHTLLALLK